MRIALVLILACTTSTPALAAGMGGRLNDDAAQFACDNVMRDAAHLMTLTDGDSNAEMPQALKTLHEDEGRCPYPTRVNAGDGYAAFAQAAALHRAADPAWQSTLDTAIAKLARCRSDYPKGKIGADCAAAVTAATSRKAEWSGSAPQPTASP